MNYSAVKHNVKWDSKTGDVARHVATWMGLKMLRTGRKLLKWSLGRCSWCGADCGFNSNISRKGKRCQSLERSCVDCPDA